MPDAGAGARNSGRVQTDEKTCSDQQRVQREGDTMLCTTGRQPSSATGSLRDVGQEYAIHPCSQFHKVQRYGVPWTIVSPS
jgi:hypothetical protein